LVDCGNVIRLGYDIPKDFQRGRKRHGWQNLCGSARLQLNTAAATGTDQKVLRTIRRMALASRDFSLICQ
jgi:hypothetical protein